MTFWVFSNIAWYLSFTEPDVLVQMMFEKGYCCHLFAYMLGKITRPVAGIIIAGIQLELITVDVAKSVLGAMWI